MSKLNQAGDAQRRLFFKKKRRGELLTRSEVRAIKEGRRQLRKELRAQGIRSRADFESTASSLGLYFDNTGGGFFLFWGRYGLAALVGASAVAMATMFLFSTVTEMRGNFTVNLNNAMYSQGFALSETADFSVTTVALYSDYVSEAQPISIKSIPLSVTEIDGDSSQEDYFAYTFYCINMGDIASGYTYTLKIISESQNLSCAAWVMLYEDEGLRFFARANEDGSVAAIPAVGDDSYGYSELELISYLQNPQQQIESIQGERKSYYRVLPYAFETDEIVVSGTVDPLAPGDYKQYTVILWLEGDDPDCTNELVGGHIGLEMDFELVTAEEGEEEGQGDSSENGLVSAVKEFFNGIFEGLLFK